MSEKGDSIPSTAAIWRESRVIPDIRRCSTLPQQAMLDIDKCGTHLATLDIEVGVTSHDVVNSSPMP